MSDSVTVKTGVISLKAVGQLLRHNSQKGGGENIGQQQPGQPIFKLKIIKKKVAEMACNCPFAALNPEKESEGIGMLNFRSGSGAYPTLIQKRTTSLNRETSALLYTPLQRLSLRCSVIDNLVTHYHC